MRIVLFCGGRGSSNLIKALIVKPKVELTLVVNGYDDGLSTGRIRDLFPGMLGPSDFRKNISTILSIDPQKGSLGNLFEERIRISCSESNSDLIKLHSLLRMKIREYDDRVPYKYLALIENLIETLFSTDHLKSNPLLLNPEMSIGNMILAGSYVFSGYDFNDSLTYLSDSLELQAKLENVSDGSNRILVGVKDDGDLLLSESEIVNVQSDVPISRVFLLESYLDKEFVKYLISLDYDERFAQLLRLERLAQMNSKLPTILNEAELLVYGSGTQHSSLFPSYMTKDLGRLISSQAGLEKVLIGNVSPDEDIQGESVVTILNKAKQYFNVGGFSSNDTFDFVNRVLLSTHSSSLTPWGFERIEDNRILVNIWPLALSSTHHDGNRLANAVITGSENYSAERVGDSNTTSTISIVLPNLNEAATLNKVLTDLFLFDWLSYSMFPEIILVDGGSADASIEIAGSFPGLRIFRLPPGSGRGEVISVGLRESHGEFVVTFPTDNEYEAESIVDVVKMLQVHPHAIVFGSRTSLSIDNVDQLRRIYAGKKFEFFLSKWGGRLLIVFSGIRFRRWVSDPLTSIKGFRRVILDKIDYSGKSLDWDTGIIVQSAKLQIPILEIPVNYHPRSIKEGKKVKLRHGFGAFVALLR